MSPLTCAQMLLHGVDVFVQRPPAGTLSRIQAVLELAGQQLAQGEYSSTDSQAPGDRTALNFGTPALLEPGKAYALQMSNSYLASQLEGKQEKAEVTFRNGIIKFEATHPPSVFGGSPPSATSLLFLTLGRTHAVAGIPALLLSVPIEAVPVSQTQEATWEASTPRWLQQSCVPEKLIPLLQWSWDLAASSWQGERSVTRNSVALFCSALGLMRRGIQNVFHIDSEGNVTNRPISIVDEQRADALASTGELLQYAIRFLRRLSGASGTSFLLDACESLYTAFLPVFHPTNAALAHLFELAVLQADSAFVFARADNICQCSFDAERFASS